MTTRSIWVVMGLFCLVLIAARPGWATCCKCLQCDSAVLCFTSGGNTGDCFETCSGISACPCTNIDTCPLQFDATATCGAGEFADCTAIDNVPVGPRPSAAVAPVLGSPTSPWFVLVALGLLVAGVVPLVRRAQRRR